MYTAARGDSGVCIHCRRGTPGQSEALRYALCSQLPDGFRCSRLPQGPHDALQTSQVIDEPLPDLSYYPANVG